MILTTKYYQGLKNFIKNKIIKENRFNNLIKLITLSIRINNRLYKY
jgi:hypothetical protein